MLIAKSHELVKMIKDLHEKPISKFARAPVTVGFSVRDCAGV